MSCQATSTFAYVGQAQHPGAACCLHGRQRVGDLANAVPGSVSESTNLASWHAGAYVCKCCRTSTHAGASCRHPWLNRDMVLPFSQGCLQLARERVGTAAAVQVCPLHQSCINQGGAGSSMPAVCACGGAHTMLVVSAHKSEIACF